MITIIAIKAYNSAEIDIKNAENAVILAKNQSNNEYSKTLDNYIILKNISIIKFKKANNVLKKMKLIKI
jgi:F0F1-type ATP synthase epsilon subunit